MTNGPIKRSKSHKGIDKTFKRRAERANKKITAIPRASGKGKIVPLGGARKSASDHFKTLKNKVSPRNQARWKKMHRRDI